MTQQCSIPVPSVTLGPITDPDYELLAGWASSKSWVYAGGPRQYFTADQFRKFVIENGRDRFLMVRTRDGRAIGAVSWRNGQYRSSFEIGAMIGDDTMWQSGFGIESVIALLGLLFDSEHAHRVEFICGVFNKSAIQACCSGLIQIEGVMRDYYYLDGGYHDAVVGSILRDEWYAMVAPGQTVPSAEKAEARRILAEYLANNPIMLRKE
jgi:RimJ/RimL family protein N-acetyltransferase